MRLEERNAIVTGAGSGIGRAIACGFAAEGARVVVADVDLPGARGTVGQISSAGGHAIPVQVDVRRCDQVDAMLATALAAYGRVHVLVAAAGVGSSYSAFLEMEEHEWERMLAVNLTGVFLCGRAVARHMAQAGGGSIINVTSQVAQVAQPACAHYVAAKGGAEALTRAMALDLVGHGIRVNALAPGLTNTAMTKLNTPEGQAYLQQTLPRIPMRRPAEAVEMVGCAIFLACDESSYVTGATMVIDGGYLAS